jgi:hypothetical protein
MQNEFAFSKQQFALLLICNGWLGSTWQNDRILGPTFASDTWKAAPGPNGRQSNKA